MNWCFRLRLNLGDTSKLQCPDSEWIIQGTDPLEVVEVSCARRRRDPGRELATWRSVDPDMPRRQPQRAGRRAWRARLMRAFACVRIGADFGDRAPHGFVTNVGLQFLSPDRRALNDVHGLAVFECEPPPVFVGAGNVTMQLSRPHEHLVQAVEETLAAGGLTEERQVAYGFFAASFSQRSADARFALLMMAVESLVEPRPRAAAVREHVESLIKSTRESGLPPNEVNSLERSLSWLRDESIGQAGRRLAQQLDAKKYKEESAQRFFTHCYEIRSRLLHGIHPVPTRREVDEHAAPLEVFVADLLCAT